MATNGMSKKEAALRGRYFDGACAILDRMGVFPVDEQAIDTQGISAAAEPRAEYEVMTDAGRLRLHVRGDGVMASFNLPGEASKLVSCNPHTGKWNHHAFPGQRKEADAAYVDACLSELEAGLSKVGPRPFVRHQVVVRAEDVLDGGIEDFRHRMAFGAEFVVEGFDQEAAAEEMASQVTDAEGGRPDWLVESSRRWMRKRPNIEAFMAITAFRNRVGSDDPSPSPGM